MKFWLKVFNKLKIRGLQNILLAVVDSLRGLPGAIEAVYPQAQSCIVHLFHSSFNLASWKDRKELAAALKPIYRTNPPFLILLKGLCRLSWRCLASMKIRDERRARSSLSAVSLMQGLTLFEELRPACPFQGCDD